MSDLFHEEVPFEYIAEVFDTMCRADQHIFQILTKRSRRLAELAPELPWPENVWMGVSVENQWWTKRIPDLISTDASVKFLSCEPLLAELNLELSGIDWVIVGGESGPRSRPMKPEWASSIREQCKQFGVPFFFKQWGGVNKKKTGRLLEGRTWNGMPRVIPAVTPA